MLSSSPTRVKNRPSPDAAARTARGTRSAPPRRRAPATPAAPRRCRRSGTTRSRGRRAAQEMARRVVADEVHPGPQRFDEVRAHRLRHVAAKRGDRGGVRLGRAEAREVERHEVAEDGSGLALLPAVDGDRHDERVAGASPRAAAAPATARPTAASVCGSWRPALRTSRRRWRTRPAVAPFRGERRRALRPSARSGPIADCASAPRSFAGRSSSGGTIGRAAPTPRARPPHRRRRACRPAARRRAGP
jgi:hypothetical protein